MKKIAIVYWSGTGNTAQMAEAVAEGAGESRMLPDWTKTVRLVAKRADRVLLTVAFDAGATRPDDFRVFVGDQFKSGAPLRFEKVRDLPHRGTMTPRPRDAPPLASSSRSS